MAIDISPETKAGFSELLQLSDDRFRALLDALQRSELRMTGSAFVETIQKAASVAPPEAIRIFYALSTLHELETERLVVALIRQLADELSQVVSIETIKSRFSAALTPSSIAAFTKSLSLLTRNERNYASSKAITDLRPAFSRDIKNGPVAFAIVHTLQITYEAEPSEIYEFFVAMDEHDLDELINVLKRCKEKAEAVKSQLAKIQMPYLTTNR